MKIAMFTNTYHPHIGGVARSLGGLVDGLRELGHEVLVVAPEFPQATQSTKDTIRIPALQKFAGSDFSIPSPVSGSLLKQIGKFAPDIIHSHHPFLLGGTALRVAAARQLPIVYTYHTRYELYGSYVFNNSAIAKRLVRNLSMRYCDLCDGVIAPSSDIAKFVVKHGVSTPIQTIPTGVNTQQLKPSLAAALRVEQKIPNDAFIVGHVGRLAEEKNLGFLTEAVSKFLVKNNKAHAIIAGDGAIANQMKIQFANNNVDKRVHMLGFATGQRLAQVYDAMDIFAFSSISETQGLVITEAMAAGVPVIALDGFGIRDAVEDGINGRLLSETTTADHYANALSELANLGEAEYNVLHKNALQTARKFSQHNTVQTTLQLYSSLVGKNSVREEIDLSAWKITRRSLAEQWNILGTVANAITDAVLQPASVEDE